ncbi:MAG: hypothetical protein GC190_10105 [Alphaproteobacteria bacterium]|nr:hypothetical protein [Alphaproteobacteria bacterium]
MRRSNFLRSAAAVALAASTAACSSVGTAIFPADTTPANSGTPATTAPVATLPSAGTSVFAPVAVAPGTPTGTPEGARIVSLRSRLVAVQGSLASHNATLSDIRQRAAADGALYRIAKGDAVASGTPPASAKMSAAQSALERFAADTTALDGEVRAFAKGAADANKLMTEADTIRGGSNEDQDQINTLRGEIGQTANQADRLVNDLSTESALQSAFLAKERAALASLGTGVPGMTPNPNGVAVLPQAVPATPALLAAPAFVTIKFDRPNMVYKDALQNAVTAALKRKPDAAFDVVGVMAPRSNPDDNLTRTTQVAQTLTTLGVSASKVRLMTGISTAVSTPEVRIYAH